MILPSAQQLIQAGRTPGSILLDAYSRSSTRELGLAWLNLGYWSRGLSYQMACQNMATVMAKLANLENCTKVIDAGSGLGVPAIYWAQHYPHLKINSLNIFADQIELAQREINRLSLTKRITQHLNCATQTPFGDASFDAVIALESAFHFNTRADFFREAYRVLRPGGILALARVVSPSMV